MLGQAYWKVTTKPGYVAEGTVIMAHFRRLRRRSEAASTPQMTWVDATPEALMTIAAAQRVGCTESWEMRWQMPFSREREKARR
jgi:hypothetical protein